MGPSVIAAPESVGIFDVPHVASSHQVIAAVILQGDTKKDFAVFSNRRIRLEFDDVGVD